MSRKRVVRLMQAEGLNARMRKRFTCATMSDHDQPVAANLLARRVAADRPNQRWVGDTTAFVIGSSATLYLAAILDLSSRFVMGWAVSAVNHRHLTIRALEMALKRRCPQAGLLHHSDQGRPIRGAKILRRNANSLKHVAKLDLVLLIEPWDFRVAGWQAVTHR